MILSDLLASLCYTGTPDLGREVTSVVSNSKKDRVKVFCEKHGIFNL